MAPDWSADWIHKETLYLLDKWSQKESGTLFKNPDPEKQAMLQVRLRKALRTNTYDSKTGILTVTDERAEAIRSNSNHYRGLFMNDPLMENERTSYAIPANLFYYFSQLLEPRRSRIVRLPDKSTHSSELYAGT